MNRFREIYRNRATGVRNKEILRRIKEGPPNSEYRSGSICWANVTLKSRRCVKHGLVKHLELTCLDGVNGGEICLRCAIDLII